MKKNKIYYGDNLEIMKSLPEKSVDLIATDPPYCSQRDYGEFDDRWNSLENYLDFMIPRIIEIHRLLRDTGSFYLHCDSTASHYLKFESDKIFGYNNFKNEIIWKKFKGRKNNAKRKFSTQTDTILFYGKTKNTLFNPVYKPIPEEDIEKHYSNIDEDGRRYRLSGGRHYQKYGKHKFVYLDQSPGYAVGSLWIEEGLQLNSGSKERLGYPTQKPRTLYERIIKASSNKDDLVLDPFCGSGTTLVAAKLLQRNYIGIDQNKEAVKITRNRLGEILL